MSRRQNVGRQPRKTPTLHELDEYMKKAGSFQAIGNFLQNHYMGTKGKSKGTNSGNPHVGQSAPLQVGVVSTGPIVNFGSATHGGQKGLRLSGSQAWLDVIYPGSGTTDVGCLQLHGTTPGVGNGRMAVALDLNDAKNMTSPLLDLGSLFLKYRLVDVTFRYVPRVGTNFTVSHSCVWIADAGLEETHYNTMTKMSEFQGSMIFPSYQPWKMKVPVLDSDIKFTDDLDASTAEIRLCMPGKFAAACDGKSGSVANWQVVGNVYLDYTIECFEMIPAIQEELCLTCGGSKVISRRQLRKDLAWDRWKQNRKKISDEELLKLYNSSLVEASAGTQGCSPVESKSESKDKALRQLVLGESPDDYYVKVPSVGRVQTQSEATTVLNSRPLGAAPTPTNTPLPFSRKS